MWKHHRNPYLRHFTDAGDAGGGAPAAPAAPADPAAPASSAADASANDAALQALQAKLDAAEAAAASLKDKAEQFDAAEAAKLSDLDRANKRATEAEHLAAKNAAELLQLRVANDNGITKAERALLTGTTEEALKAQVAAVLGLRAPAAPAPATARDAGITGGGAAPKAPTPTTLSGAISAHYEAKQ